MKTRIHTTSAGHVPTTAGPMNAVVQDRYGEAEDVLRLESVPRPEAGDDAVLGRVHAAGVDQGVWHVTAELPYPVRLAGYGLRAPKRRVRGGDLAGTVAASGSDRAGVGHG